MEKTIYELTTEEFIELMNSKYDTVADMIEDNPFIKQQFDTDVIKEEGDE